MAPPIALWFTSAVLVDWVPDHKVKGRILLVVWLHAALTPIVSYIRLIPQMYRHYLTKIHSGAVIATCVVFGCLLGVLALLLEVRLMYGLFPQSQLDIIPKRGIWNSFFGEFAVWFDLHLSPWFFPQLLLDDPVTSYYTPWFFKFGA